MGLFDKHLAYREAYNAIRQAGADPFNVQFDSVVSPTEGRIDGRSVILLGTNNYLGLTFDEEAIAASVKAVQERGTGTTGSRIANGSFEAHVELEQALAKFYRRKHAMVFTTGYQANLGVLSTLVGRGDHLILDADSHASIYDGSRLGHAEVIRFRHNDPEDLYKRLRRLKGAPGERLIVVEGIYSMMGDTAPLKEIAAVKREMGGYLLVDEAHSMGVLGENGRGLAEMEGVEADVDFVVGTFSKSLGAIGGYCVSDDPDFDMLRITCRPYMFTASLPPSIVASVEAALALVQKTPEMRTKLWANVEQLYGTLERNGFLLGPHPSPVVAVHLPDPATAIQLWHELLLDGVYVNLTLPPATPNNSALLRCSVCAAHSSEQIATVAEKLTSIAHRLGAIGQAPRMVAAS